MTINQTETQMFEDAVDGWVLEAIACGIQTFDQLIASLPGVYPSVALNSLQRLTFTQRISTELLAQILKPAKQKL